MNTQGGPDPQSGVSGLEQAVLSEVRVDDAWEVVERFSHIVRETGSEGEREAVSFLAGKLASWGIPHTIYTPTLLVSLPRSASVEVTVPATAAVAGLAGDFTVRRTLKAKTPSFSLSTAPGNVISDLLYLPSTYATSPNDVLAAGMAIPDPEVLKGKAVMTEGLPLPGRVTDLMDAGAAAVVFISPGERIHEGICTSIWGAPDLESVRRKPCIPVVSVSHSDGEWLKGLLSGGAGWSGTAAGGLASGSTGAGAVRVSIRTDLEEGWKPVSVLVADIRGSADPDKFVLVHGHLDSWHVGVSDNATGNATLLELARVLSRFKGRLGRSVRVAWWSGHSHGRYAGSTWYADNFALDVLDNCVAHMNCDSTGCRDATEYAGVSMTGEFEPFCREAIRDAAGAASTAGRVPRAGDCSFANLGVGTFYMLLASIPEDIRQAKGLYHVGGSGGNNEWHHEDDTIEVADRSLLLRDTKVYVLSALRAANSTVLPYDLAGAIAEIRGTIEGYAREAGSNGFDMTGVAEMARTLEKTAKRLDQEQRKMSGEACSGPATSATALSATTSPVSSLRDPRVRALNDALLAVQRLLVRVNYVRGDWFKQDPALEWLPVPDLAGATELTKVQAGSDRHHILRSHLRRGANKVEWTLREAKRRLEDVLCQLG